MAKDTPIADPEKGTGEKDPAVDFEKRYKDLQSHTTKVEQELKEVKTEYDKDKELLNTVEPYIDWDRMNPEQKEEPDINAKLIELQRKIELNQITQDFRTKYPDMVPYEELVGAMLSRTDARRPMPERIGKAVGYVQKLLEAERLKGIEEAEKKKKDKKTKEAEASGFSESKNAKGEKEPEGETYEDYIKDRKTRTNQAMGIA